MKHLALPFCLIALLVNSGCEKKDSATSAKKSAPAGESTAPSNANKPAAPKTPEALSQAQNALEEELRSPKSIATSLAQAQALDKWLASHPTHPQLSVAKQVSAELKLQAVAAAAGLKTPPSLKALTDAGGEKKLLEEAATALSQLTEPRNAAWRLAAESMLASDPGSKEKSIDRKPAMELAISDSDAGIVLRTYWLSRLEDALTALQSEKLSERVASVALQAGNLLCPACDDARHATQHGHVGALNEEK